MKALKSQKSNDQVPREKGHKLRWADNMNAILLWGNLKTHGAWFWRIKKKATAKRMKSRVQGPPWKRYPSKPSTIVADALEWLYPKNKSKMKVKYFQLEWGDSPNSIFNHYKINTSLKENNIILILYKFLCKMLHI